MIFSNEISLTKRVNRPRALWRQIFTNEKALADEMRGAGDRLFSSKTLSSHSLYLSDAPLSHRL